MSRTCGKPSIGIGPRPPRAIKVPSTRSTTITPCASTRSRAGSSAVATTFRRLAAITPAGRRGSLRRVTGEGNFWVTEYVITYEGKPAYAVSIVEFRDGKLAHETQYFVDPFDAPAWRAQWVEREPG